MTSTLTWILPALVALATGWLANDWFNRRRLKAMQAQVATLRQTTQACAQQAQLQIDQLRAELAARPASPPSAGDARAGSAAAACQATAPKHADADAFAPTDVARHEFANTEVMD